MSNDNDAIVDDNGFRSKINWGQAGYAQSGSRAQYSEDRYSDTVANGDYTDDKPIEWEEDPNVDLVDYNGHTNAGYGAKSNSAFFR